MAYFDESVQCSDGKTKRVRVPSLQGGTDRNIYVNGNNSGYYLGQKNNRIYKSGREVSSLPLKEFAKEFLWEDENWLARNCQLFLLFLYLFI